MYEEYFGLIEKPFRLTPDPRYFYCSESFANALKALQLSIGRRDGFVVITGDAGTGKTMLCRSLPTHVDKKTVATVLLNPFLSEDDLLEMILQKLGIVSATEVRTRRPGRRDLLLAFQDFLLTLAPLGATVILVIDDAQDFPLHLLERIRILSNIEGDSEKLLQIVLVGDLDLPSRLRSEELRQLDQRISIRYRLEGLTEKEVTAYIEHRLKIAGGHSVTFTRRARRLVYQHSAGLPGLINLLCDRALLGAYAARTKRIDKHLISAAAEVLDLTALAHR